MLSNMTDRHITVKHEAQKYAHLIVEHGIPVPHNKGMQNLARIRKQKKMTQTQLADAANCNQGTISKIEKGGNYTMALAARLAKVLGVTPVELIGATELEQRYLSAMRSASPERQRAVLLLLEGDDAPPDS